MTVSENSDYLSDKQASLENISLSINYHKNLFAQVSENLEQIKSIEVYSFLFIRHLKFRIFRNIQSFQNSIFRTTNSWIDFDYSKIFSAYEMMDYIICFNSTSSPTLVGDLIKEIGSIVSKKEFQNIILLLRTQRYIENLAQLQLFNYCEQSFPNLDISSLRIADDDTYRESIYYKNYLFGDNEELIEEFFERKKIVSNLQEDILLTKEAIEDFFSKISHHLNDTSFQHDYAELMDQVLREKLKIEDYYNSYTREKHNIEDSFSINEFCTISEVFDFWIRDYKNKGFGEVKLGRNHINSILQKYETETGSDLDLYTRNILFRHFTLENLYVRKLSLELDLKHELIINDQGFTISNSANHAGIVLEPEILDHRVKSKAVFIFSY